MRGRSEKAIDHKILVLNYLKRLGYVGRRLWDKVEEKEK